MSLLEKDICNTVILKQIVEIQKYFRNVHLVHGLLKKKGGCMPQLPNEICWNSQVAYLETYKRNYNIYSEIWGENMKKIPTNIGLLIDKIGLYRETSNFFEKMMTFVAALDKMQGDSCHLSDAVHIWYSLLKNNDLAHHDAIKKRFGAAKQPFHFLAYMTDHHYLDEWKASMDLVHQNSTEEWLVERDPNFISLLYKLTLKDQEMFPKGMFSCSLQMSLTPSQLRSIIREVLSSHFSLY